MIDEFIKIDDDYIVNKNYIDSILKQPTEDGRYQIIVKFKDGNFFKQTNTDKRKIEILFAYISDRLFDIY